MPEGLALTSWIVTIIVALMLMIMCSIVIHWTRMKSDLSQVASSTVVTAQSLAVIGLIPAVIALIVVILRIVCNYSPAAPFCGVAGGLLQRST